MANRGLLVLAVILALIIVVLTWFLIVTPTPTAVTNTPATTTVGTVGEASTTDDTQPLSARVSIDTPRSGATAPHTFPVTGKAPGNWYFEASFPIQVRDMNGAIIGNAIAQAQSDWMTTNLVAFTSTMTVSANFSGPAKLILLRDNPSGLPENDDAVEIPIVIQ